MPSLRKKIAATVCPSLASTSAKRGAPGPAPGPGSLGAARATPRAVFFDVYGVLIRDDPALYDEYGAAHGLPLGAFHDALFDHEAFRGGRAGRLSRDVWVATVHACLELYWGAGTDRLLSGWWATPRPTRPDAAALRAAALPLPDAFTA